MKPLIISAFSLLLATFLFSCTKNNDSAHSLSCDLPATAVPSYLVGNWASGYSSSTDIVDTYSGQYLGNEFQSGKYFHFDADGKYAEFYYMANAGLYASSATKAVGTVEFLDDNSFIFHACSAHYKGWESGVLTLDRDATDSEVAAPGLTQKYYYTMETYGDITYMVIRFDPTDESGTSFESVP